MDFPDETESKMIQLVSRAEEAEARVAELEAGRSDLIATIEAMNEENAQLAHRLWCLENPE